MKYLICILLSGLVLSHAYADANVTVPPEAAPAQSNNPIPFKKQEADTGADASRSFAVMAVLLGVAGVGLYLAKRYFPHFPGNLPLSIKPNAQRRLKLLETLRLTPKATLFLVQFDDRTLLLAQSGDSLTLVEAPGSNLRGASANPKSGSNV